jgi:hypothetical protein
VIIRPLHRGVPWKSDLGFHAASDYTTNNGGRITTQMTRSFIKEKSSRSRGVSIGQNNCDFSQRQPWGCGRSKTRNLNMCK